QAAGRHAGACMGTEAFSMFETWLGSLVSTLQEREKDANMVMVDWLLLARQLYINAVNNTQIVRKNIVRLLDWLQESFHLSEQCELRSWNVHLIGYSLGTHVAGFAGNHVHGTIGRITGLDPAGLMFEGVDPSKCLSPDDANFVDVLHTYTRETLGVSIGIQMPVGHVDIYPNGGDFQPGCGLSDVLGATAYGSKFSLLILSLDSVDSSQIGICLSCQKNCCNSIGYNMYLKTRADMLFKGMLSLLDIRFKEPSPEWMCCCCVNVNFVISKGSVLVLARIELTFLELGEDTAGHWSIPPHVMLCSVYKGGGFSQDLHSVGIAGQGWAGYQSVGGEQLHCALPVCTFCYYFVLLQSLNCFFFYCDPQVSLMFLQSLSFPHSWGTGVCD
uniref:Lipase domain-containing protein n=1 Tax=Strix occidentalis caurina TaxID=311401 RepID=A0A8D0F0L4_STROC